MVVQMDEVRKARRRDRNRAYYEANKEKALDRVRAYREENKEKITEYKRAYYETNKKKVSEGMRAYYEANKEKLKAYQEVNKERIAERNRAYYEANKEQLAEYDRAYYEANKEKVLECKRAYREANKEKVAKCRKAYREANKEKVAACAKKRYATDDTYRLSLNTRSRIGAALKTAGLKKSARTIKLLGCNLEAYRKWIESHLTDGMSWNNQDEWHVDHTYPVTPALRQFGEAALPVVFNYRNCKPMWAKENISKKDKIPPDSEIHPWVKEKLAALVQAG